MMRAAPPWRRTPALPIAETPAATGGPDDGNAVKNPVVSSNTEAAPIRQNVADRPGKPHTIHHRRIIY